MLCIIEHDYANSSIVYMLTIQIRRNVNIYIYIFVSMDIWFRNIFHRLSHLFEIGWWSRRSLERFDWSINCCSKINFKSFPSRSLGRNIDTNVCKNIRVWFMKIQISSSSPNKFVSRKINRSHWECEIQEKCTNKRIFLHRLARLLHNPMKN